MVLFERISLPYFIANVKQQAYGTMYVYPLGKRQCAGENLAKMELFLYFASLMKHFKFSPAPGHPLPNINGVLGATSTPTPFHILMEARD